MKNWMKTHFAVIAFALISFVIPFPLFAQFLTTTCC